MLFDAHELDVAENLRQTTEVVAEARRHGAHVEGEIEGIQGVEDGIGSDDAPVIQTLEVAVDFITRTGVDCFAPAIGNAHGQYKATPTLDHQRVSDLVEATGVPMALHGGTGLSDEQFTDLIARGCAKVNISTALKEAYMKSSLEFLRERRGEGQVGPSVAVHPPADGGRRHGAPAHPALRRLGACLVTALIFDCDGVLADTERYGHLPAFNATFAEHGLPVRWSEDDYAEKLRIGGGKERMASLFADPAFVQAAGVPDDDAARAELLATWHRAKTAKFRRAGRGRRHPGPARHPAGHHRGARRRLDRRRGVDLGRGVRPGRARARGGSRDRRDACRSSPATSSRRRSRIRRSTCSRSSAWTSTRADTLVVEDSRNGLLAATRAGLPCLVTVNGYTREEVLRRGGARGLRARRPGPAADRGAGQPQGARPGDLITLDDLRACVASTPHAARPVAGEAQGPQDPQRGGAA